MIEAALSKISEVGLKEVGKEGLKKSSENLPNFAKDTGSSDIKNFVDADKPINTKSLLEETKNLISDKVQTGVYEAKGLVNDSISHQFFDPKGNPLAQKMTITDMIGKDSIRMPYVGSDKLNSNSVGYLRDSKSFWREYESKHSDTLSSNNSRLIENGKSPIVDKKWIDQHPNQKSYLGERLEHHHRNNTDEAYAVPQTLHRGRFNKEKMHVD